MTGTEVGEGTPNLRLLGSSKFSTYYFYRDDNKHGGLVRVWFVGPCRGEIC